MSQDIPGEDIYIWPDVPKPDEVNVALVWKHEFGSLVPYKGLRGICSFGAGVDSILADPLLPKVPVARIVDPDLASNMSQFVVTQIQHHKLRMDRFERQQKQSLWLPKSPKRTNRVGILGLGQLGEATARLLVQFGFKVMGWSRTHKSLDCVQSFSGKNGFDEMIPQCDYLVCLLPLTNETDSILDRRVFEALPNHAVVINVARGEHLVDEDLLWALDNEQLDFAYLDVFRREPLEPTHPFWAHSKVRLTPHVSAVTNIETATIQIVENYKRVQSGLAMMNVVDLAKGY